MLHKANKDSSGATIFAYHVNDPKRYGVVEFDSEMNVKSLEGKAKKSKIKLCCSWVIFL